MAAANDYFYALIANQSRRDDAGASEIGQVPLLSTTLERSKIACILKNSARSIMSDVWCNISHALVMILACLASRDSEVVSPFLWRFER